MVAPRRWGLTARSFRYPSWTRRDRSKVLGVAALCAACVALGLSVGALGRGDVRAGTTVTSHPPAPPAEPRATPEDRSGGRRAGPRTAGGLVTKDVTVQVLNATRVGLADDRMVRRLEGLGFRVVAVNPSAVRYTRSTVYWSRPEGRAAALALARRFGWEAGQKPGNLSASVTIHVVVGRDES